MSLCFKVSRPFTHDLQREVYLSFPHGDFWDQVDKTLDTINSNPEGTRFRCAAPAQLAYTRSSHLLSSCLKAILSRDRRIYGVAPGATVVPDNTAVNGDEPLIQRRIEDLIEAPGGATAFQAS